jgi:outer membrane protein assembly factor BamB
MLWRMEGRFDKAVPVMAQGSIYIGTFRDGLWRVDAASGKLRWIFAADAWICSAPCVGEGRVFFGDTAGRFACVDADRGELLWTPQQWRTNRIACSVAPVLAGALVYVRLDDGVLYCLDATSGEEVVARRCGSLAARQRLPEVGSRRHLLRHAPRPARSDGPVHGRCRED